MFSPNSIIDEFVAKYLMDAISWLSGGKKKSGGEGGTPRTPEDINITAAEVQEVMFAIYGAPGPNPTARRKQTGIDPAALDIFEQVHTEMGHVRGDKLERALALALKQLKNGLWPKSIETVIQRPLQQRRGNQNQPASPNATTSETTTRTTVHIGGWEPHRVFVRAFNHGFETLPRARKFVQVLTQESIWDQAGRIISNADVIEKGRKLARTIFWTWVVLILLTGGGAVLTSWRLIWGAGGVGIFLTWAFCFAVCGGLIALPINVASKVAERT